MSHTPVGGHPQGWEHKLADRSSLPPAPGEEKGKSHSRHVFAQPQPFKSMSTREETEGSSASSAPSSASPPYLRWARTLHDLLDDTEGVRLFRKFVGLAGGLHVDRLNFYFAVKGLRQETEPAKIRQFVFAIYKFLRKSQLSMPEDLKQSVKTRLKDGAHIEKTVFDQMEREVTRYITETTYQAFLRSDAYVSYVSAATQPLSSPDDPAPSSIPSAVPSAKENSGLSLSGSLGGGLATLHEGQELGAGGAGAARLTHDALLATQSRRLLSDAAPGSFGRQRSVYAPHLAYAGYCPASRIDSERASLSSGRADSDAVSLSGSSLDGMSLRGGRAERGARARLPGMDRHEFINKEHDQAMVIPRTARVPTENLRVLPPAEFAPLLIEKLERVRRERESNERFERRLAEGDGEEAAHALPPQLVAAAIREKLQVDDDNDQDILDQHVSRVWSERTPGGSPPPRRARPARRPRAPSTASADSGLCDPHPHPHPHPAHAPHPAHRRSFTKKAAELTDSGVSVVSEGTSASGVEPRILLWIAEGSDRLERLGPRPRDSSRASSTDRDDRRSRTQPGTTQRRDTRPSSKPSSTSSSESCTVVVVSFLDEAVPYRIRVPQAPLTLKTFKDYLPKKGNYRYFFKTECADLDNTVIQEELCSDSDVLPLFEGKVMARVKAQE